MTTDLELALEAATAAGKLTLHYFRNRTLKVFTKRDLSPVTEADRNAEKKIISIIRSKFPKDGFLGEEFGEKPSKNARRWIIDPIDGTKSFIHGVPLYGVMLGLEVDGEMQLGVIDLPALSETVYAERGYGAYRNVHRLSVSEVDSLSEATLLTSSESYLIESRSKHVLDTLKRNVKLVRMWGDCWGHTLVAAGQADIMVEPKMSLGTLRHSCPSLRKQAVNVLTTLGRAPYMAKDLSLQMHDLAKCSCSACNARRSRLCTHSHNSVYLMPLNRSEIVSKKFFFLGAVLDS